jgi:hypothetical protein
MAKLLLGKNREKAKKELKGKRGKCEEKKVQPAFGKEKRKYSFP